MTFELLEWNYGLELQARVTTSDNMEHRINVSLPRNHVESGFEYIWRKAGVDLKAVIMKHLELVEKEG
jgi:hypothetical protein